MVKTIFQVYSSLPKLYKMILGTLIIVTLVIIIWQPVIINRDDKDKNILQESPIKLGIIISNQGNNTANINQENHLNINNSVQQLYDKEIINKKNVASRNVHIVSNGDNLSSILTQYGLHSSDIAILSNQYTALRDLRKGQTLSWRLNKYGELHSITWIISYRETRIYTRKSRSNVFTEEKQIYNGVWVDKIIQGKIKNNFIFSAINAGLTYNEAHEVCEALQWQIDLRKIKSGDKFAVLLKLNMINGHREQSKLLGVHLLTNGKHYYAFKANNGNYYDSEGNIIEQSFLRYPTAKIFRVSSPFSLRRINPVTGRPAPHHGVDFSMPIGTSILSVADGEVIVARYSRAAGNFIVIRHGRQYTTCYMHLRKLLVKLGQKVKKGERIALSGNTGRTTGPHLHYELWINNRAVDPLTANLSFLSGLTGKELQIFLSSVKEHKFKLATN